MSSTQAPRQRARSLSDVSKLDNKVETLQQLRPFLIMLSLVDMIKTKWDKDRLELDKPQEGTFNLSKYLS